MSKQIDRARDKHRDLIKKHHLIAEKIEREERTLVRLLEARELSRKAIARSSKRLDKLIAAKTYTTGPTGSVLPDVIEKITV